MQQVIVEESVHARLPRGFATDPFPQNIIYDGMKIPKVINTKITNHNLKKKKREECYKSSWNKSDNNKKLVTHIGRYTLKPTQLQEAHYQS